MIRHLRWLTLLVLLVWTLPALSTPRQAADKPAQADYELFKLLADTIDEVERNYVTEVDRRELIEAAVRGVLGKLDPHSSYIGPDEIQRFRAGIESQFGGIGIQIAIDDGQLMVLSPIFGTPAYRAGILAGDRILEIDGKPTDGLTIDDAVKLLKGDEGAAVTLTILHAAKDAKEKVTLKREKIHVDTVLGDRRQPDGRWEYMLDPKRRLGYVRLSAFSRDTAAQLRGVLERLKADGLRGLILDLRYNPGGLLTAAVDVSDLFVSEGRIVSTEGRNSPARVWTAHQEGTFERFPMVVLVNRFSASSSEIVAACLQDHQRALIVGERTWGKGSVQNLINLEGGRSALKLTTASYRRPSGKNIHRFPDAKPSDEWGVTPDKGYRIDLGEAEMLALLESRRHRDILQPASAATASDRNGSQAKQPAASQDRQLQAALKYLEAELAKAR
ncbi:MAG: S41 family peptidase [Thermoguttaceae bacterium]